MGLIAATARSSKISGDFRSVARDFPPPRVTAVAVQPRLLSECDEFILLRVSSTSHGGRAGKERGLNFRSTGIALEGEHRHLSLTRPDVSCYYSENARPTDGVLHARRLAKLRERRFIYSRRLRFGYRISLRVNGPTCVTLWAFRGGRGGRVSCRSGGCSRFLRKSAANS